MNCFIASVYLQTLHHVNATFLQGCLRSEFPGYVGDSIDGYLEESHKFTVLDVIGSFINSKRYPPPSLLHTVTQNLLLVS